MNFISVLSHSPESHENCEQMGDILQWDQSNKNYILTQGVSGVDWRFYKHPLPEQVYDAYMKFWSSTALLQKSLLMQQTADFCNRFFSGQLSGERSLSTARRRFEHVYAVNDLLTNHRFIIYNFATFPRIKKLWESKP